MGSSESFNILPMSESLTRLVTEGTAVILSLTFRFGRSGTNRILRGIHYLVNLYWCSENFGQITQLWYCYEFLWWRNLKQIGGGILDNYGALSLSSVRNSGFLIDSVLLVVNIFKTDETFVDFNLEIESWQRKKVASLKNFKKLRALIRPYIYVKRWTSLSRQVVCKQRSVYLYCTIFLSRLGPGLLQNRSRSAYLVFPFFYEPWATGAFPERQPSDSMKLAHSLWIWLLYMLEYMASPSRIFWLGTTFYRMYGLRQHPSLCCARVL